MAAWHTLPPEVVARIHELHAQGLGRSAIARAVGVSPPAVGQYIDPSKRERARRRQIENRERYNAAKLRGSCDDCGGACGPHRARCKACHEKRLTQLRRYAAYLYEQGVDIATIAVAIDATPQSVRSRLTQARRLGELHTYRQPNVICTHASERL